MDTFFGSVIHKLAEESSFGRVQSAETYDPLNRLIKAQSGTEVITYSYDPLGRRLSKTSSETELYLYDGSTEIASLYANGAIKDPNEIATVITYDPYGREAARKISNLRTEERQYDPAGNLIQIKEGSRITRYTYNALNLPKTLVRAFGTLVARVTAYDYTPSGLLKTKTQPDGTVLNYTSDPFGYPKTLVSSDGILSLAFTHNSNGFLLHASDERHSIDRTPDPFGNILTETINDTYTLTKTYDPFNRPLTLTLPDESSIHYTYSPVYLKTVERLSSTQNLLYRHSYDTYDLSGALLTETLPLNLGKQSHSYDPNQRLITLTSPYFTQTLDLDPGGRIKKISSEGSYSYDDLDELTLEPGCTYSYDDRYNRIAKNDTALTHNLLDEIEAETYDLNGNLKQKGPLHLTYDPLNRLIKAESGTEVLTYSYDPLGRRLSKTSSETELYLYDGSTELASLYANGAVKDLKVSGLRETPIAVELQEQVLVPISDYRGSIRKLIDPHGQIAQEFDYTAFGEETTQIAQPYNPWRYAAKRFDLELGLTYFGHRYYDAMKGFWITTDPAGFVDGTNLYAYVLNNPLSFFDSDGQSIGGYLLGLGEVFLGGAIMAGGLGLELATCGGFTFGFIIAEGAGAALIGHGLSLTSEHAQNISYSKILNRNSSFTPSPVDNYPDKKNKPSRNRLNPDERAVGDHTVFKKTSKGKTIKYETYQSQTNTNDPKPWESVKRYDGPGSDSHWNKVLKKDIDSPHVHDPSSPGGVRPALQWEIPK